MNFDKYLKKRTEGMQRVCKAPIKSKGGYFEESKLENLFCFGQTDL